MEDRFFCNYWNPVRPRYHYTRPPTQPPKLPKVVSVPVHFVGSEEKKPLTSSGSTISTEATRSAAALKIQKSVRGFLVRNNVRVVRRVEAAVDEIEKTLKELEGLIRTDEKHRLRLNEMLMSALFRLDSVRGVREYRKKVIRRAISLQDVLDSMVAGNGGRGEEKLIGTVGNRDEEEEKLIDVGEMGDGEQLAGGGGAFDSSCDRETDQPGESCGDLAAVPTEGALESKTPLPSTTGIGGETLDTVGHCCSAVVEESMKEEEDTAADAMEESAGTPLPTDRAEEALDTREPTSPIPPAADTRNERKPEESMAGVDEGQLEEGAAADPALPGEMPGNGRRESVERGMKEVMERMVEENEKLKGLVAELCHRNTMQCRLMSGISQRVEQLEKDVERMGRKKRKQQSHRKSSGDNKRCGRKL